MSAISPVVPVAAAGAAQASTPQPRLVHDAHEFEAQMLKEMLKPMTGKDSLTGEEAQTGDDSGSNGALGEFASEALGRALSQGGGFGLANRIVHDLSHSGSQSNTGKVTSNLHINTVMDPSQ